DLVEGHAVIEGVRDIVRTESHIDEPASAGLKFRRGSHVDENTVYGRRTGSGQFARRCHGQVRVSIIVHIAKGYARSIERNIGYAVFTVIARGCRGDIRKGDIVLVTGIADSIAIC